MHISQADIEELKARVDLVELIGSAGVKLKRPGRPFVGEQSSNHESTRTIAKNNSKLAADLQTM